MKNAFTHCCEVNDPAAIPTKGTLSRTLHNDEFSKTVWFGFAAGEELSEHTASMPATLYFIHGAARLTLDGEKKEAHAGTWVHMPAHLRHSLSARTPVIMLLTLIKSGKELDRAG